MASSVTQAQTEEAWPHVAASAPTHEVTAAAVSALEHLSRPVAVIAAGGRVLYGNPPFHRLLAETDQHGLLDTSADMGRQAVLSTGGRTFLIERSRVPEGVLIVAEEVSASGTSGEQRRDALTGLRDRIGFSEHIAAIVDAGASPAKEPAAVLTIELDMLKSINESIGRDVGDGLLRLASERLSSALQKDDVAARLGADQFAVLQRGQLQPAGAVALAKRLIDLLGRSYIVAGNLLNVRATVGIAPIFEKGLTSEQILRNAALAMQQAKRKGGKGTHCLFEAAMDAKAKARRALETDLRRALAMREFKLVYQPQFNIAARRITGFEALLRWHHAEKGLISPAAFIPLAEQTGLIVPIGEWVIRKACREAAAWPDGMRVAVNVSALQITGSDLVDIIRTTLEETGLDPRRLEIEVTESLFLGEHRSALDVLSQIRSLGVRMAMDDFGTGYSSLSYLRSFPFEKIKIDQSFVRSNANDASGMAIVRAIASLGRNLNMTVTAEGVETGAQLDSVADAGCTDVQGYLISKPLPPEGIAAFLRSQHGPDAVQAAPAQG